jgi:hypothetical protein
VAIDSRFGPDSSAPLAFASITAVLKDLLSNGLVRYSSVTRLGDVSVSVLPPDRVTLGAEEASQLNVFLYRVTPHTRLAHGVKDKNNSIAHNNHLVLDLHYLLTAYGAQDFHEEILLGCAVHLLNSVSILTRELIRKALESASAHNGKNLISPARTALSTFQLSDQFQELKITPQFLSFEEMSKLWSMLQARYRPSIAYEVSAVTMTVGQ